MVLFPVGPRIVGGMALAVSSATAQGAGPKSLYLFLADSTSRHSHLEVRIAVGSPQVAMPTAGGQITMVNWGMARPLVGTCRFVWLADSSLPRCSLAIGIRAVSLPLESLTAGE